MEGEPITAIEDVPSDSTVLFTVEELDVSEMREAILIQAGDEVICWVNECQHMTHIPLDKGRGAPTRGEEIICTNHGAMFEKETGLCTFGPCEGAYLDEIEVSVSGDDVYLVDDDYAFVKTGPIEEDGDLTSTSNVEF